MLFQGVPMWTDCNCGRRNAAGDPCPWCGNCPEAIYNASGQIIGYASISAAAEMLANQYGDGPMDPIGLELALQTVERGQV